MLPTFAFILILVLILPRPHPQRLYNVDIIETPFREGTSLEVRWLRPQAFNAEDVGSIPGQWTKSLQNSQRG